MTWTRATKAPPKWAPGVLRRGDRLDTLAAELGLPDHTIPTANGVPWPGRKTYGWARDISTWVLATGGRREEVVPNQPNKAEPGQGFTSFNDGQIIYLPAGARPLPGPGTVPPPSQTPPKKKSKAGWIAAALAALTAAGIALSGKGT